MDVRDSLDLGVEQISTAVNVQLELTKPPGLQNVGAEGCRVDLAQRPVGLCRCDRLGQWQSNNSEKHTD